MRFPFAITAGAARLAGVFGRGENSGGRTAPSTRRRGDSAFPRETVSALGRSRQSPRFRDSRRGAKTLGERRLRPRGDGGFGASSGDVKRLGTESSVPTFSRSSATSRRRFQCDSAGGGAGAGGSYFGPRPRAIRDNELSLPGGIQFLIGLKFLQRFHGRLVPPAAGVFGLQIAFGGQAPPGSPCSVRAWAWPGDCATWWWDVWGRRA